MHEKIGSTYEDLIARLHDPSVACVEAILRQGRLLHSGDRLECLSCSDAMRSEGGCRIGGTTSGSAWGIGAEMNGYDAGWS